MSARRHSIPHQSQLRTQVTGVSRSGVARIWSEDGHETKALSTLSQKSETVARFYRAEHFTT